MKAIQDLILKIEKRKADAMKRRRSRIWWLLGDNGHLTPDLVIRTPNNNRFSGVASARRKARKLRAKKRNK